MKLGRPRKGLQLSEEERAELEKLKRSRNLPAGRASRVNLVLLLDQGLNSLEISQKLNISAQTVCKWRKRFQEQGINGLGDEPRPGRPRRISEERVAELLQKTLADKPKGATHWSCRRFAEANQVSKSTVQRIWNAFALKPHRHQSFKLSTDPNFVDKLVDVTGLYLNPPDKALVICVDEKSQCQALERTQPVLPLGMGYIEGYTHDYERHGTTTLFAALEVATGKVMAQCRKGRRHQQFIDFLRHIDTNTPQEIDLHVIVDNYATHKHPNVQAWLAQHPRFKFHFTPTYSSWLNQVEIFFGIITRQAIRRGSFTSVKELVSRIDAFVSNYNATARPFAWTASAQSILLKLERLLSRISGTQH